MRFRELFRKPADCPVVCNPPLRVESVAWIAERKGVLSATFYFISLLSYVRFKKNGLGFISSYAWFVCSFSHVKKHGRKFAVCFAPDGLFDGPRD